MEKKIEKSYTVESQNASNPTPKNKYIYHKGITCSEKGTKIKSKYWEKNILENNENISTAYIICTGIR